LWAASWPGVGKPEQPSGNGDIFSPRMPQVDEPSDIGKVFDRARKAASDSLSEHDSSRQVVLVTPGRMLMLQPCPPPGSMPKSVVGQIEKLISPQVKRKIAVNRVHRVEGLNHRRSSISSGSGVQRRRSPDCGWRHDSTSCPGLAGGRIQRNAQDSDLSFTTGRRMP
jgi:hypothetical protein